MSTSNLIRWSGPISLSAGGLYAFAAFLHPAGEGLAAVNSPNFVPAHLLYWVSATLMLFSLVGLYARQVEATGWLGLVGFVLALIGTALAGSILLISSTVMPLIAAEAPALLDRAMALPAFKVPVLALGFVLGYVLFGVATMRAGVFPRGSGVMLIVGISLFPVAQASLFGQMLSHVIVTVGDVAFGMGLAWMGYRLWSEKHELAQ